MRPAAPGVKLTYEDLMLLPDDWVIDPELDTVTVYRRVDDRYVPAAELSLENGEVLTTPLLPGLDMPLAKIFEQ